MSIKTEYRHLHTQPEITLWVAVLERALLDLEIPRKRTCTLAWIRSKESGLGSFNFVAEILEQDPKKMRHMILQMDQRQMQSLQKAA